MECGNCQRPNRSDIHLSKEEEAKLEEETRDYFDGLAPKRHTKPQRSEYSSHYVDALSNPKSNAHDEQNGIPEFVQFQRLENDSQKLIYKGTGVTDEFVETEYYKDLNCIDKQHHTTGTGFIKVENVKETSFNIAPDSATGCHTTFKGNPATNDWIPATADMVDFVSDKPNRSDN
ncbi:uncharacterized protein LOC132269378 [Cornus florida]|uniref:uncharacterized protein LOC132269378 n=1 Tax=Cornus florida TaxID=4283 RepID=UPI00289C9D38|nr:uncharacterized protein LOC132269378 [Cornus florida]